MRDAAELPPALSATEKRRNQDEAGFCKGVVRVRPDSPLVLVFELVFNRRSALWHTRDVQRLCALLLLTLSAWLLVAPLAASPSEQSLLPACCRKLGAHHCASTARAGEDRLHASLQPGNCMLMPHHGAALLQRLNGLAAFASLAFLVCWSPFFSSGALQGYARALAAKSSRGPPLPSFA